MTTTILILVGTSIFISGMSIGVVIGTYISGPRRLKSKTDQAADQIIADYHITPPEYK
jgi:hypothetical protein